MESNVTGQKIKIGIADDHELFSSALTHVLQSQPEYQISYVANDGEKLLALINSRNTDVLITDIQMPGVDGYQVIRKVKEEYPEVRIIAISMFDGPDVVLKCINLGVNSFVSKSTPIYELKIAIRKVLMGGNYFDDRISRVVYNQYKTIREKDEVYVNSGIYLTEFEKRFIRLICMQKEKTEIMAELKIAKRTYDLHKQSIQKKVSAKNTHGLVLFAVKYGLFKH